MKRLFLKLAAMAVAGALAGACGGNDSGDDRTPGTMIEVAARSGEISALVPAAGLEAVVMAWTTSDGRSAYRTGLPAVFSTTRSTTFFSSRILPVHRWATSASIASGVTSEAPVLCACA